jgi:colicin import membrane protein
MAEARHQPGRLPAIILAVLVHVAFIAVLVFGVDWQNHEPAPMVAELWNSLPGVTAPPPPQREVKPEPEPEPPKPKPEPKPEPRPEPPPAPTKADIALKKAKEEKAKQEEKLKEDKRKEEEKKKDLEKKKKLVEEEERKRVQESFQREQKDIQNKLASEIQAREAAETARRAAASARSSEIGKYTALIRDKVRSNIVAPPDLLGNPQAVFEVTVIPSGEVINVRLTKSSGNAAYDGAVERAIRKSSPLPLPPADKGLFEQFRQNELKIRPSE